MVIPVEEFAVSLMRAMKYMVRQAGQTRQVQEIGKNNICYLPQSSCKKFKGGNIPEQRLGTFAQKKIINFTVKW